MSVVQRKVSVRLEVPFFRLMKVNPALSPVCGKCHHRLRCWSGRRSTCARWIQTQCTHDQVWIVWEEQVAMHWTTQMNMQREHKAKAKCNQSLGWIGRRKDTKAADTKGKAPGEWLALCYGRGAPYSFFPFLFSRLYLAQPFFLQWLRSCSFPGHSRRSWHPDLDLRFWFLLVADYPPNDTSLYGIIVFPILP